MISGEREIINAMIAGDIDAQLALSRMCDSSTVWHIAEHREGIFTLYNHKRAAVLITEDWNEILLHYRQRPAYIPTQPIRKPPPTGLVFNL